MTSDQLPVEKTSAQGAEGVTAKPRTKRRWVQFGPPPPEPAERPATVAPVQVAPAAVQVAPAPSTQSLPKPVAA